MIQRKIVLEVFKNFTYKNKILFNLNLIPLIKIFIYLYYLIFNKLRVMYNYSRFLLSFKANYCFLYF